MAGKGKTFDVITETKVLDDFPNLKKNLSSLSQAFYVIELVDRLTREEQENKLVFDLLLEFLTFLDSSIGPNDPVETRKLRVSTQSESWSGIRVSDRFLRNFETKVLDYLGFWPHNGFEKFDSSDLKQWGRFNKSLIEWVLEGSLKSEGFLELMETR